MLSPTFISGWKNILIQIISFYSFSSPGNKFSKRYKSSLKMKPKGLLIFINSDSLLLCHK